MSDSAGPVVAWVSLAVVLVGGLLALLRYINSEITQERTWREEADDLQGKDMKDILRELGNFKLDATRTFAPYAAIEKLEQRLVVAIEKIAARQETMIGRVEHLTSEIAKRRTIPSS